MEQIESKINSSFEVSGAIGRGFGQEGWEPATLNRIGGAGTLGRVRRSLKEMQLVVRIKRLRTEVLSASSDELISLGSSLSRNSMMDHRLWDLQDLVESVDSHKGSSISSTLGVDSLTDYTSSESDSDSGNEDGGQRILQVDRYVDNAVITEHVVWVDSDHEE